MIAIVDSGGANLASVRFALERLGQPAQVTSDPELIRESERVILPGVGAAGASMARLRERGLIDCLRGLKQPVLGICLGMQLFYERSEEGDTECLGVFPGTVRKLGAEAGRPVPHLGWNRVEERISCPLLNASAHFYFVHSYVAPPGKALRAVTGYGSEIPAIVNQDNWFGVQFHPERSGEAGSRLLREFIRL